MIKSFIALKTDHCLIFILILVSVQFDPAATTVDCSAEVASKHQQPAGSRMDLAEADRQASSGPGQAGRQAGVPPPSKHFPTAG